MTKSNIERYIHYIYYIMYKIYIIGGIILNITTRKRIYVLFVTYPLKEKSNFP